MNDDRLKALNTAELVYLTVRALRPEQLQDLVRAKRKFEARIVTESGDYDRARDELITDAVNVARRMSRHGLEMGRREVPTISEVRNILYGDQS